MVETHAHNGIDAPQISFSSMEGTPQASLTTASVGSLTSGGSNDLRTADANIINNAITRLNELEDRLQNLGLLS